MSRATIMNLTNDYKYDLTLDERVEVKDIEIVPRKMVEMILERCQEEIDAYTLDDICYSNADRHYANGRLDMAYQVRDYANVLLKQFEEDKE